MNGESSYPSIDVLIPFHKVDRFLLLAIKSACESVEVSPRIILLDDRPNSSIEEQESISEILQILFNQGINYRYHKTIIRGYANALNESKSLVTSDYVAILNSDDLVHPKRFKEQIKELESGAEISLCKIRKFSKMMPIPPLLGAPYFKYDLRLLLIGAYGGDATLCCHRTIWQTDLNYKVDIAMADWEMALRCFGKYKVGFVAKPFYMYRMHPNQVSRERNSDLTLSSDFYLSWQTFAEESKVPKLDIRLVALVATPWVGKKDFSSQEVVELDRWLFEFKSLLRMGIWKNNGHLVERRKIALLANGLRVRVSPTVCLIMTLNLFWTLIVGVRPRRLKRA